MVHWALPAPDKDDVVQDEFNYVNGYHLIAPIASGAARGETPNSSAKNKITWKNFIAPHLYSVSSARRLHEGIT